MIVWFVEPKKDTKNDVVQNMSQLPSGNLTTIEHSYGTHDI